MPGVGKTEVAKVLAECNGTRLIRLQCYEGLDASGALYEWNYPKQLLHVRLTESAGSSAQAREAEIFSEPFLLKRPLLEAITQERPPVLLIDEVDRADEAFEAFLLEVLRRISSDHPGDRNDPGARDRPAVILTSNRTRELSDALRRRCLYLWMDYPTSMKSSRSCAARLPGIDERLAAQIAPLHRILAGAALREGPRRGREPRLGARADAAAPRRTGRRNVGNTLGCVLKVQEDWELLRSQRSRYLPLLGNGSGQSPPPLESDYGIGSVEARRG